MLASFVAHHTSKALQKTMLTMSLKLTLIIICSLITSSYSFSSNDDSTTVKFYDVFKPVCGNVSVSDDGNVVDISLKNNTGASVFMSQTNYSAGLFSAYIKLPSQSYTGGIVVTFYLSNGKDRHDEIDFEILGHTEGEGWILQTNFYGNGSITLGREERYNLTFDTSNEAHKYSIYWTEDKLFYYIDDFPIRVVKKVQGGDYPSKPMVLYGTIWDGSDWATHGGKAKANFTFEPFVAEYSNFTFKGCWIDPNKNVTLCGGSGDVPGNGEMTPDLLEKYLAFRKQYLTYSYCLDKTRYNPTLPECLDNPGKSRAVH